MHLLPIYLSPLNVEVVQYLLDKSLITDSWCIIRCQAYTSVNINEEQCEDMYKKNQWHPTDSVVFSSEHKEEIFVGVCHVYIYS